MSAPRLVPRDLQFSLMFFACTEDSLRGSGYRLVVESARFADREGFSAVWVPERHFTGFGYLYPNPAVLHAALARETRRLALRAGSVVAPLHDPLRIAEEWAMVDNLSGGRVGVSFASGWNPSDFAFFPDRYAGRHDRVYETVATVKRLWRGEPVEVLTGTGERASVRIYPTPVQAELPVWITAAGSPKTFARAGEIGANVLTHLLDHGVEEIAERIQLYRQARAAHGHDPDGGQVTIMVHTFLGEDAQEVKELIRAPYCSWLKANAPLLKGLATNRGVEIDLDAFSPEDKDQFVNLLFERFFSSRSLMGTPETCLELVGRLQGIGVTEIACLLDFGPAEDLVLRHLPHLHRLKRLHHALEAVPSYVQPVAVAPAPPRVEAEAPRADPAAAPAAGSPVEVQARCEEVEVQDFYETLCRFGARLETRFRGVRRLWRGNGEALGHIRLPEGLDAPEGPQLHPALLDACLQVFAATLPASLTDEDDALFLPVGLEKFEYHEGARRELWSHAVLASDGNRDHFRGDIRLMDERGRALGLVGGFRLQRAARAAEAGDLGDWLYGIEWVGEPAIPAQPRTAPGRWLILADQSGLGRELAARLAESGDECVLAYREGCVPADDRAAWSLAPGDRDGMRSIVEKVAGADGRPLLGVVHAWGLDARGPSEVSPETLAADQLLTAGSALCLAQALLPAAALPEPPRLWLVTRGAQAAGQAPRPVAPTQSLLWGFGKSCAVEHAEIWGGLVDLDPHDSAADSARQLAGVLQRGGTEDQVALREGQPLVPRLVRRRERVGGTAAFRPDATYLVTGGLGGIGLRVAEWLARNGARHLLLLGREVPSPEAWDPAQPESRASRQAAALRALQARGCTVVAAAVDVADEPGLAACLAAAARDLPAIRGVFHAAGIGRGGTLASLELAELDEVLLAKVAGGWWLHRLLSHLELDFFVLFSSATHQLGVLGQGTAAYSAASAFLDGLAHHRRAAGLPGLSVDWGPWSEVGMAAETGNVARLEGFGIGAVAPRQGTRILGHLLQGGAPQVWAIPVSWERLLRADTSLARSPFVAALAQEHAADGDSEEERAARERLRESLARLPAAARPRRLESYIQEQVVAVMRLDSPQDVDWRRGLFEIGMDSLMALELKNRLQTGLGVPISSTLAFDHPTVDSMAGFLARAMFPGEEQDAAAPAPASALDQEVAAAEEAVRALDEQAMERLLEDKLRTL